MPAFATPADFLERYDSRTTGDLVADDGQQVNATALLTNPKLLTALADASGDVEAALIVGGRYSVTQLASLTGNSLSLLKRLVCELGKVNLLDRRMDLSTEQIENMTKLRKMTDDKLIRLRNGENLFNIPEAIGAGLISTSGPSTLAIERLNLIRDRVGPNYYPARRMPFDR